jgi:hypothetical protein
MCGHVEINECLCIVNKHKILACKETTLYCPTANPELCRAEICELLPAISSKSTHLIKTDYSGKIILCVYKIIFLSRVTYT